MRFAVVDLIDDVLSSLVHFEADEPSTAEWVAEPDHPHVRLLVLEAPDAVGLVVRAWGR